MPGLYLEQFELGQVFRHAMRKTITEGDNMLFSTMTLNPQPLYIDHHFAGKSEYGRPTVNPMLTLGLVIGISVYDTTFGTALANLGMSEVAFPAPVFHGDTIRVETEVIAVRPSRSKDERGIIEFEHRGFNQHDVLVTRCRRQAMMLTRASAA
ncbi:MaoC family dehydratase [Brucella sp. IR073]|uniref:MaoC family dehydratase n=1 Tax=unclassified Brucella TaxID=2632610 RepID=UPI003B98784F